MNRHWGGLPVIADTESGIAAIEREQITKPRSLDVEGAKLHQPSPVETTVVPLSPEQYAIDPLTLHTIKLIHHARKVKSILMQQQEILQQKANEGDTAQICVPLPPIPEAPDAIACGRKPGDIKDKDPMISSDFMLGKGQPPPELCFSTVHQVLRRAVTAICAHAGFDTAMDSVLETLTDLAHEYTTRICSLLRVAVDREALTGNTGFVDVMEQVFHECGIGSITELHYFYQSRMVNYHEYMMETCKKLVLEYDKLRVPEIRLPEDIKLIRVKEEPMSEIQFPASEDETDAGDKAQTPPPLEELHGALQTMEPEGSSSLKVEEAMKWLPAQGIKKEGSLPNPTPNLDPDEEIINVSDSPEPQQTSTDISQCITISEPLSPNYDLSRMGRPPKKKKKK